MSLRGLERSKATFVVVPPLGEVAYKVDPVQVSKYLREPQIQQLPTGIHITSVRDQIVIRLGPRIEFEDQSDYASSSGGVRLAEVAHSFLHMIPLEKYRAYGWNFHVAFDAFGDEPAAKYISEVFINQRSITERARVSPLGASMQLYFEHSSARCRLSLEPNSQDLNTPRFSSHINYHYELTEDQRILPRLDDLKMMSTGLWAHYLDLLERLVRP